MLPTRRGIIRDLRFFGFHPPAPGYYHPAMNCPSRLVAVISLLLAAASTAAPADAQRIQKTWDLTMERWSLEIRAAATPEARAKVNAGRPDATPFAKQMWEVIGPALSEDWTLEPAAWFLRATPGLLTSTPEGSTTPTFAKEIEIIRKTVETRHIKSAKLTPMCMALAASQDPRSLGILEKIQTTNPNKKVQGVAALAAAMVLKTLGDDPEMMRKRLTYLRKAIVESSDVEIGGTTVAKLAEDELYIIRFLTKGRVAPDIAGIDSAGRPLKLSDFKGKVVMLLFWSSTIPESDGVIRLTAEIDRKFKDRPFAVVGVNNDTLPKLRSLEADNTVPWKNFSDTTNQLAAQFRVGSWPLVYVLDGDRKIHYSGTPGSFAEATVDALLAPPKPAAKTE
jgi:peroxiredoxin